MSIIIEIDDVTFGFINETFSSVQVEWRTPPERLFFFLIDSRFYFSYYFRFSAGSCNDSRRKLMFLTLLLPCLSFLKSVHDKSWLVSKCFSERKFFSIVPVGVPTLLLIIVQHLRNFFLSWCLSVGKLETTSFYTRFVFHERVGKMVIQYLGDFRRSLTFHIVDNF